MGIMKEEKSVTVEQRSGSDAKASVTKNGRTGEATGKSAAEAISGAKDKAGG